MSPGGTVHRSARGDATRERRSLGRALLARQHLLRRHAAPAVTEVAHLVGLQAQAPWTPYTGLRARLDPFAHADLADRLLDRSLVRIVAMRGTVHLLTAEDALLLPALCEPLLRGSLLSTTQHGRGLRHVDLDELAAAARDVVEERPTTPVALGRRLAERWPEVDPASLAHGARGTLPLVQVPPRAVWGRSGATTWTTTRAWLGREPVDLSDPDARDAALDDVVLRYLAAFGPASVADVRTWSGLRDLAPVLDRLRPRLVTVPGEPGPGATRRLVDLPGAPRPGPDVPAPVRFLPGYENLLLSHADRSRVVDDDARRRLSRANGAVPGAVLVDGTVAGQWTVARAGAAATLTVEPFRALTRDERAEVGEEAEHVVRFVADGAVDHSVRWRDEDDVAPPSPTGLRSGHDPGT